jgi:hypothetical protein
MEMYGITGSTKKLYTEYLKGRCRHVSTKDTSSQNMLVSKWSKIQHGEPQGYILGPVSFLIYINDLPIAIGDISIPILFADNPSVLISSKNPYELDLKLNMVLHIINNWLASNLLSINFQKTQFMQFTTKNATTIGNKVQVNSNEIIQKFPT